MKPSELIRKHGWCQGSFGSCVKGYCAVGAVRFSDFPHDEKDMTRKIIVVLGIKQPDHFSPWPELVLWNDMPGRTKEEVIGLLESVGL